MSPNDLLLEYLLPPTSILLLLFLAVIAWPWRGLSRGLFVLATLGLLLASLPTVGAALLRPLADAAPTYLPSAHGRAAAIVVPTAGSFSDGSGRWWPTGNSVARLAEARRHQDAHGLPIIVSGGAVAEGQPSEAETVTAAFGAGGPDLRLETTARNSAETALAVAAMLADEAPPLVLLVTSPSHVARMASALRHQGLRVVVPAPTAARPGPNGLLALIPSYSGLKMTRAALYEYAGIAHYLVAGHIDFGDLRSEAP